MWKKLDLFYKSLDPSLDVYEGISKTNKLYERAKLQLLEIDKEYINLNNSFNEIKAYFNSIFLNLNIGKSHIDSIHTHTLEALNTTAKLVEVKLDRSFNNINNSNEILDDLKNKISELKNEVKNDNSISNEIKIIIDRMLSDVEKYIIDFLYFGINMPYNITRNINDVVEIANKEITNEKIKECFLSLSQLGLKLITNYIPLMYTYYDISQKLLS